MSTGIQSIAHSQRQFIRLWNPEESAGGDDREITSRITLTEFFEWWFVPIVMTKRKCAAGTITKVRDALNWWAKLTGDPPLETIDEFTLVDFQSKLERATYRRGALGRLKPLAPFTQAGHLKAIDELLYYTGPTYDPKRPTKRLLDFPPRILVEKPELDEPKHPFTIEQARAILAAVPDIDRAFHRRSPSRWRNPTRLRALLLILYFTGLRIGTVLQLRWSMLQQRKEGTFLKIPRAIVTKTHKGLTKFLHEDAAAAILLLPGPRGDGLIFDADHAYSHVSGIHRRLQTIAGIAPTECLSPHAWRRTHGTQMSQVGKDFGLKIAQHSLDHADDATTRAFYVHYEPEIIRRLPRLTDSLSDPRQRTLF